MTAPLPHLSDASAIPGKGGGDGPADGRWWEVHTVRSVGAGTFLRRFAEREDAVEFCRFFGEDANDAPLRLVRMMLTEVDW